jgi:hypothetical protein
MDFLLLVVQRPKLAVVVVHDAYRARETPLPGALGDGECIRRVADASSEYGVDVHVEVRVLRQQL